MNDVASTHRNGRFDPQGQQHHPSPPPPSPFSTRHKRRPHQHLLTRRPHNHTSPHKSDDFLVSYRTTSLHPHPGEHLQPQSILSPRAAHPRAAGQEGIYMRLALQILNIDTGTCEPLEREWLRGSVTSTQRYGELWVSILIFLGNCAGRGTYTHIF